MQTSAYFEDIPEEIARRLLAAREATVAAVAWFTDRELFDVLCRQAGRGVRVRLAVLNDAINVGPGRLNFQRLRDVGGEVFLIPVAGEREAIMHHKFCVIDGATVIMGSYNWTRRAQDNDESIAVITDAPEIAADYLDAFDALLGKHGLIEPKVDLAQIRRRVEIVRNLLLLEEWEALAPQIEKLRLADAPHLAPLFAAVEAHDPDAALGWIDSYLRQAGALALATDQEIAFLRLTLRGMECQVAALSAEKAEIERLVHTFSARSSHEIGDLVTRYLELRAEKLRRQAPADPAAQADAESARADYRDYREANESARASPAPPELAPADLQELKRLYREASQKCHPDKVNEADRERANELFVELQAAYRNNDLAGVRAIHAAVRDGHLSVDRAANLTESESLGHAIAGLRRDVARLIAEIRQLRESEAYRILSDLDDWDVYFEKQRVNLRDAIARLEWELGEGE